MGNFKFLRFCSLGLVVLCLGLSTVAYSGEEFQFGFGSRIFMTNSRWYKDPFTRFGLDYPPGARLASSIRLIAKAKDGWLIGGEGSFINLKEDKGARDARYSMNYAGFQFGRDIWNADELQDLEPLLLIGLGSAQVVCLDLGEEISRIDRTFLVMEPGIQYAIRVFSFLKLHAGASFVFPMPVFYKKEGRDFGTPSLMGIMPTFRIGLSLGDFSGKK